MSNTLRRKTLKLFLVTVLILTVIILTKKDDSRLYWLSNFVNVGISPFQKLFSLTAQRVEGSFIYFRDTKLLKEENEKLKQQIDTLQKENRELQEYKLKIQEFKTALNLKDQFNDYEFIGANVIAKDPGNWFNVFTIDRGIRDAVDVAKKGESGYFPVITSKGLVGRVLKSDPFSAKVLSVIDPDSTVSGRMTRTRDTVVVRGDVMLKEKGLCRLEYLSPELDISVGDTVETSGLGGVFPKGIIIGQVKEIRQSANELNRYAIVEPAVDFKRLEEVFIMKAKEKQN